MRQIYPAFFPTRRAGLLAGLAVAALLTQIAAGAHAQQTSAPDPGQTSAPPAAQSTPQTSDNTPTVTGSSQVTTDAQGRPTESIGVNLNTGKKKKQTAANKADRIQQTKDTREANKKDKKFNPLIGKDADLPDKQLYDKALVQIKSGHYDVGRLDLQTLLNTYPDSQYQMRAKLAVADAWYKEGGSAALAQAEQEYTDFITFFPNAPEAAEAQMRVGDIYFKQIDATDRDSAKIIKAEDAYRLMLKTYPDAPARLLDQARQDLREVQELLAERESQIGLFYAGHENWAAAIARLQSVADTYPQYSHMDDTLIALGDAYSAQARGIRAQPICGTVAANVPCLPEGARAKLLQSYESKAEEEYRKVVLEHAAAPHVEDAKERLIDMGQTVPTPSAAQVAASDALEGSRAQYTMRSRLELLVLRHPNTVTAARAGDPPLEDPAATLAPGVLEANRHEFNEALNPAAAGAAPATTANEKPITPDDANSPEPVAPAAAGNQSLSLSDVPGPGGSPAAADTTTMTPATGGSGVNTSIGMDVVAPVSTRASDQPSATGALPAAEATAPAPDQVNGAEGLKQPAAQAENPNAKKNPKAVYDKNDESSSKKKQKKGVDKLNPF